MAISQNQLNKRIQYLRNQNVPEDQIQRVVNQLNQGGVVEQQTGLQKVGQGVLNVGKAVIDPLVNTTRMTAALPGLIGSFGQGVAGRLTGNEELEQSALNQANWIYKNVLSPRQQRAYAPTGTAAEQSTRSAIEGAKTGAGLSSYVVPGGTTLKTAVGLGALGGGLRGFYEEGDLGETTQNVLGGAFTGGVIGGGIYGAGRAINWAKNFRNRVKPFARDEATKSLLNMTERQYQDLIDHGMDPVQVSNDFFEANPNATWDDFLKDKGIFDTALSKAETQITKTRKIAGRNQRVDGDDIIKNLKAIKREMRGTLGGERKLKALDEIIKAAEKKYKNGTTLNKAMDTIRTANKNFGKGIGDVETKAAVATSAQKIEARALRDTVGTMYPEVDDALRVQETVLSLRPLFERARNNFARTPTLRGININPFQLFGLSQVGGRQLNQPQVINPLLGQTTRTVQQTAQQYVPSQANQILQAVGSKAPATIGSIPGEASPLNVPATGQGVSSFSPTAGPGQIGQGQLKLGATLTQQERYQPIDPFKAAELKAQGEDLDQLYVVSFDGQSIWNPSSQQWVAFDYPSYLKQSGTGSAGETGMGQKAVGSLMNLYYATRNAGVSGGAPGESLLRGTIGNLAGFTQLNASATNYNRFKAAFTASIARASGEKGTLTDKDRQVIVDAMPKLTDTSEVADQGWQQFANLLSTMEQKYGMTPGTLTGIDVGVQ